MLRLTDQWGVLQCDVSGGLITADFQRALVPAPSDTTGRRLIGPGWVLELNPGWQLQPGQRPGDWVVRRAPDHRPSLMRPITRAVIASVGTA